MKHARLKFAIIFANFGTASLETGVHYVYSKLSLLWHIIKLIIGIKSKLVWFVCVKNTYFFIRNPQNILIKFKWHVDFVKEPICSYYKLHLYLFYTISYSHLVSEVTRCLQNTSICMIHLQCIYCPCQTLQRRWPLIITLTL